VNSLIGHESQRKALSALVSQDRLPSSLLFSGAAGIGKRRAAHELAERLLCHTVQLDSLGGCGSCSACRLIKAGNHPDLRLIECGGEDMSVDTLRETLERLSLRPFMGLRKVTILNDADLLSLVGANILLKTLEEPRPENCFILVASTPSRLPQTVLSRCQRWFFDRLSQAEMESLMHARGASDDEIKLVPFADGSPGALDSIRDRSTFGDEVVEVLEAAWRGDTARIVQAAQDWGAEKTTIQDRIAFLRASIRKKLIDKATDKDAAAVWSNALQNAIDLEYLALERHTNPTLAILQVLQSCNKGLATAYQVTPNSIPPILEKIAS
jgi:DNA polymerase III delta' subunit